MNIQWMRHRKSKKAHGFVQLGGGGVKPWIVSLCKQVRFKPNDLTAQMHEPFTKDMHESNDQFCEACIERFSKQVAQPKLQMKWPSVTCPECGEKAWMTDSAHIILCEHCKMNFAFQKPLYEKEPKVEDYDDRQKSNIDGPGPSAPGGSDKGAGRGKISSISGRAGKTDGVGTVPKNKRHDS